MFPDTIYISLGIAPNADAIVLQPVIPDSCLPPPWAFTISIAELNGFGRADAIQTVGWFALTAMRSYYPVINIFAKALISPAIGKKLAIDPPDHSGSKRARHLRIKAIVHEKKSLLIARFNGDSPAGGDTEPILMDALMQPGPDHATDFIGATLLDELIALHPDVFATFPALGR